VTARGDQLLCAGELVGVEMSQADQQVRVTEEDECCLRLTGACMGVRTASRRLLCRTRAARYGSALYRRPPAGRS